MSSYLSSEYKIVQPQPLLNTALVVNTLDGLQSKYDQNKALVDNTIAKYEMLRGLSPMDNEYIAGRVKEAESAIENYKKGGANLAYGSTRDSMLSAFESVAKDPLVQNAVQQRVKFDNFNSEVAKLKEKNDGRFNDINYNDALKMAGVQDYMQGKTKSLGALNYSNYIDLPEEHLKKLKNIKEIKGKRFIEMQNPSDPREIIRKEIDGLTEEEIQGYFNGIMTSEELGQLAINGRAKYDQPNAVQPAKEAYIKYNQQLLKNKETNLKTYEVNKNNKNLSDEVRESNRINYDSLNEQILQLKELDFSKIDSKTIAFELEKANYTNSLTQMASTEWSKTVKKNDIYYADQELDLDKQRLEIDKEKLGIEKDKLKIERIKLGQEFGVDDDGNPLTDAVVAKSSKSAELVKELEDNGIGASNLKKQHDDAYKEIFLTASDFLKVASKTDKEAFIAKLSTYGVDSNLKFKEGKGERASLANTVYEAFKQGNFGATYSIYGERMEDAKSIKSDRSVAILNTTKQGLVLNFNKDPDKYITSLKDEISSVMRSGQSDLFEDLVEGYHESSIKAQKFVDNNGGWTNLKTNLIKNPNKLVEFAKVLDGLATKGIYSVTTNTVRQNLLKDSKGDIEKSIQSKTNDGSLMSVYSDFTFLNDKAKENVVKMIPTQRLLTPDGTQTDRVIDPKGLVSFYKDKDKIILTQSQKVGIKDNQEIFKTFKTELDPGDAGYQEIVKLVDFNPRKGGIKASATTDLPSVRVTIPSHKNDEVITQNKAYSIMSQMTPQVAQPFINTGVGNPALLATKETATVIIDGILKNKGIPTEKIEEFKTKLYSNINSYDVNPKSHLNVDSSGYVFGLEVKKGDKDIMSMNLNLPEIDSKLNYLINYHSHIFVINQLLYKIEPQTKDKSSNIDAIIKSL